LQGGRGLFWAKKKSAPGGGGGRGDKSEKGPFPTFPNRNFFSALVFFPVSLSAMAARFADPAVRQASASTPQTDPSAGATATGQRGNSRAGSSMLACAEPPTHGVWPPCIAPAHPAGNAPGCAWARSNFFLFLPQAGGRKGAPFASPPPKRGLGAKKTQIFLQPWAVRIFWRAARWVLQSCPIARGPT